MPRSRLQTISLNYSVPPPPAQLPPLDSLSDLDLDSVRVDKTCDQVRKRLQNLLDNNEYKTKKAMFEAMDVSSASFNRFMAQHGRDKGLTKILDATHIMVA